MAARPLAAYAHGSAYRVALPRWWGASRKPDTAGRALGLERTCSGVRRRRCGRLGRTARLDRAAVAFATSPLTVSPTHGGHGRLALTGRHCRGGVAVDMLGLISQGGGEEGCLACL